VDEDGNPVRGPIGRYGGPKVVKLGAAAAVLVVLISLVLINPFSFGGDSKPGARSTLDPAPPGIGQSVEPEETPGGTPTGTPTGPTPGPGSPTETPSATPTPTDSGTPSPRDSATPTPTQPQSPKLSETPGQESVVFQNCAEARAAGKTPLHRGDPGYSEKLDKNGDGIACEKGNS
jgi:hypothetical protein